MFLICPLGSSTGLDNGYWAVPLFKYYIWIKQDFKPVQLPVVPSPMNPDLHEQLKVPT